MATPLIYDYRSIPVYERDEDFLFKALSYKQNKLDTNRAQVQNLYDQYSMLSAIKGVDQEYINGRLDQVTKIVNEYSSGDLSSDYLAQNLMGNLDQMVDQKVINAVTSKSLRSKENQEWETARLKGGKEYAELNEKWAKTKNPNWQAYLASEEVGAVYNGGSEFVEFVDMNKLFTDNAQKLSKLLRAEYVETVPGQFGYFVDVTGKKVDRDQMQAAMMGLIGPKERKQLEINGWGQYGNLTEDQLRDQYDSYLSGQTANDIAQLEKQKLFLEDDTQSEEDKEKVRKSVATLESNISKAQSSDSFDQAIAYGREFVETKLYTNRLTNDFLNGYSFNEVTSIKVNDSHKFYVENMNKQEEIAISKYNAESSRMNAEANMMKANAEYGTSGTKSAGGGGAGSTPIITKGEKIDVEKTDYDNALEQSKNNDINALTNLETAFDNSGIDPKLRKGIISKLTNEHFDGLSSKSSIVVDGKTIKLNDELKGQMIKYWAQVKKSTSLDKEIEGNFKELVSSVGKSMEVAGSSLGKGNRYDQHLPLVAGVYKKGQDGRWRMEGVGGSPNDQTDSNAVEATRSIYSNKATVRMVNGKPVSTGGGSFEEEEAKAITREIHQMAAIVTDPSLTPNQRAAYAKAMNNRLRELNADAPIVSLGVQKGVIGRTGRQRTRIGAKGELQVGEGTKVTSGISSVGTANWTTGIAFGTTKNLGGTAPADVLKAGLMQLENKVSDLVEKDKTYARQDNYVYNSKSKEAVGLRQIVASTLQDNDINIDDKQDIRINTQYKEGGKIEYTITYATKDGRKTTKAIPSEEIGQVVDLARVEMPVINSAIPGQSIRVGSIRDMAEGDNLPTTARQNLQGIKAMSAQYKSQLKTEADKQAFSNFYADLNNKKIRFEIETLQGGGIGVNLMKDGKVFHTATNIIQGEAMWADEITNPTIISSIQKDAIAHYINKKFNLETESIQMLSEEFVTQLSNLEE